MLSTFYEQYLIVLTALLIANYNSRCLRNIISIIGSNLILLPISWYLTKYLRRYLNRNPVIGSYKKAVLVTGCDSGFGNRLAYKLNENGFMVYATVLDTESEGSKYLRANAVFPSNIKLLKLNITSEEEVKKTYDWVSEDLKQNGNQLWGLVNNAGIVVLGYVEWGTIDSYLKIFDVNVFGMVRVTRSFLPLIRESKGRIVNVSSILSKRAVPCMSGYCMSKSAVDSFSDALRRELTKWGVSVSVVLPGYFHTNMTKDGHHAQILSDTLNNTDPSVKQAYSELINRESAIGERSDNIDLVVDSMVDALRSDSPQINYTVGPRCRTTIFMFLNDFIPQQFADILEPYLL